ncbi:MAG: hypothetical protein ACM3S1_09010 [Hyphomicrobiales bacterium]
MLFDAIFLGLFLAGWLICAYIPWVALSIATRGNAGIIYLPLCLLTGVVAALMVPILGFDGPGGLWSSFVAAFVAPALLLAARRYSLNARPTPARERDDSPAEPGHTHDAAGEHQT